MQACRDYLVVSTQSLPPNQQLCSTAGARGWGFSVPCARLRQPRWPRGAACIPPRAQPSGTAVPFPTSALFFWNRHQKMGPRL